MPQKPLSGPEKKYRNATGEGPDDPATAGKVKPRPQFHALLSAIRRVKGRAPLFKDPPDDLGTG